MNNSLLSSQIKQKKHWQRKSYCWWSSPGQKGPVQALSTFGLPIRLSGNDTVALLLQNEQSPTIQNSESRSSSRQAQGRVSKRQVGKSSTKHHTPEAVLGSQAGCLSKEVYFCIVSFWSTVDWRRMHWRAAPSIQNKYPLLYFWYKAFVVEGNVNNFIFGTGQQLHFWYRHLWQKAMSTTYVKTIYCKCHSAHGDNPKAHLF